MRRMVLVTAAVLASQAADAAVGELQNLLDKGFRVVGVSSGPAYDPIVIVARENEVFACRSYVVVRPAPGQSQCVPVK